MRTMLLALLCPLAGCATQHGPAPSSDALRAAVMDTERAFARSMAQRDFAAFQGFLAEDAVFFSGPTPLRGKAAVVAFWKRFYEGTAAPFSWEPAQVEVLSSGTLALSTGPVRDPAGKVAAEFTSVWRREPSGRWRIVLDKGSDACECRRASP